MVHASSAQVSSEKAACRAAFFFAKPDDFSATMRNANAIRCESQNMMTIPFFVMAAALGAIWSGHRNLALALWGAALLTILVLFRIHATSQLGLGL